MRETKVQREPAQMKADFGAREIEGYAAIFNNVDLVGDIVMPGAFRKTLAERMPRKLVKVFYDHTIPVGMPLRCVEDSTGLLTVSKISAVPEGDKVLQFVADGLCAHMSFAYDVTRRTIIESGDPGMPPIRQLNELRLYEYGPVHWPANEQAEILTIKHLSEALAEARSSVPQLAQLLGKRGYLADPELDLFQHISAAIKQAIAASIEALSEPPTEPASQPATTGEGEPPPAEQPEFEHDNQDLSTVAAGLAALSDALDALVPTTH